MEKDKINIIGLKNFEPSKNLILEVIHENSEKDSLQLKHSYNKLQIEWFKYGSALNYIKQLNKY